MMMTKTQRYSAVVVLREALRVQDVAFEGILLLDSFVCQLNLGFYVHEKFEKRYGYKMLHSRGYYC